MFYLEKNICVVSLVKMQSKQWWSACVEKKIQLSDESTYEFQIICAEFIIFTAHLHVTTFVGKKKKKISDGLEIVIARYWLTIFKQSQKIFFGGI